VVGRAGLPIRSAENAKKGTFIRSQQSAIPNPQSKILNQKFILSPLSFFHPTIRFFFDTRIEYPPCTGRAGHSSHCD